MASIKGIFEPFQDYVKKQLKLRKKIVSNSNGGRIKSKKRYEPNLDRNSKRNEIKIWFRNL